MVFNIVLDIHYESPSGAPRREVGNGHGGKKTGCWAVRFFWRLMSSSESGHRVFYNLYLPIYEYGYGILAWDQTDGVPNMLIGLHYGYLWMSLRRMP